MSGTGRTAGVPGRAARGLDRRPALLLLRRTIGVGLPAVLATGAACGLLVRVVVGILWAEPEIRFRGPGGRAGSRGGLVAQLAPATFAPPQGSRDDMSELSGERRARRGAS